MNGKTSPGRQAAASGYAPLASAWTLSARGSSGYVSAAAAGVARAAPFTAGWPLRSFLELGPFPGAVPCARLHARQVLWEWGVAVSGESTELVVSELVTNAVQASRAIQAAVRMWLVCDREQVVVFVWDASPQPPARAEPGEDAENGRGLLLVEAVSERWGHFGYDGGGKVVWAVVSGTEFPGPAGGP
jgi:hypothetical protein